MDRKSLAPILIISLTIPFAIISLLVWLNSSNRKLVAAKIRLGAFLLSLNTLTGCFSYHKATCYMVHFFDEDKKIDVENLGILVSADANKNIQNEDLPSFVNTRLNIINHQFYSKNYFYGGLDIKIPIDYWIENKTLIGCDLGYSRYFKLQRMSGFNVFTEIDYHHGSKPASLKYNSLGINIGYRMNDFILFWTNDFGIDIYSRYQVENITSTRSNLFIGARIYYNFGGN